MNKLNFFKRNLFTQIIIILVAIEIIAISINFFFVPINIAAGGSTGLAILANAVFGWNRALVVFILNTLMVILAAIFLGKKVVTKITIGSYALPILMEITPSFKVVNDSTLAMIIGSSIFGFGVSLLYYVDASSGGTTIPPLIFKKFWGIKPSFTLLIIDGSITALNIFVNGSNAFFLAIFSLVITYIVMNYIMVGFDHRKLLNIMSEKHLAEIKSFIDQEVDQGYTIFNVQGGRNGDDKEMLLVVISNQDYPHFISSILEIDPKAFLITYNISDVTGGFFNLIDQT